jgi:UDP-N-acetylglucosamine/UDP-N-acetylgalactosamine diphosphorylase
MQIFEVEREHEFAPVKNAPGELIDSPDTARVYISNMSKNWLRRVGAKLIDEGDNAICEILPLTSYAGEGLEGYYDREIRTPFLL